MKYHGETFDQIRDTIKGLKTEKEILDKVKEWKENGTLVFPYEWKGMNSYSLMYAINGELDEWDQCYPHLYVEKYATGFKVTMMDSRHKKVRVKTIRVK